MPDINSSNRMTQIAAILVGPLILLNQYFCAAFQPDGSTNNYPVTIDRLQEQLAAPPLPEPVDPGPPNYWFHPKIHTLGNHGPLGSLHAIMAPLATKIIDVAAYKGENVRDAIAMGLRAQINTPKPAVVDLACGVGMSTRSLLKAFPKASKLVAVDTSAEMLHMAEEYANPKSIACKAVEMISDVLFRAHGIKYPPHTAPENAVAPIDYRLANAEDTGLETGSFDLASIMYCFHEAPYLGRARILREAHRILAPGATLAIVDISPSYEPIFSMLAGEPYVLEYQENIQQQLERCPGFKNFRYKEVVPGQVGLWLLERDGRSASLSLP
eukprot:scaffold8259_cov143-Cylindrotheca_fusiformis.AAC.9